MLPVLLTVGSISVSSFGVFLVLGFLFGVFLIWRLSRAWDLEEEKVLDLTLLTFLGGLIGARLYFVLQYPEMFTESFLNILLLYKVPGLSFWGAILGGWLTLFFACRRKKMDFAQLGDIASVGFLGSLIFANLGCFLGSCNVGVPSNLFLAVSQVGVVGKRFPVQLLEAIIFMVVLRNLWSTAIHFHTRGKILSLSLIYIGLVKLILTPLRAESGEGPILSLVLLILGFTMFYKVTKKNPITDLKNMFDFIGRFATESTTRKIAFQGFKKYWYNRKTSVSWKIRNLKKALRRFNVRVS